MTNAAIMNMGGSLLRIEVIEPQEDKPAQTTVYEIAPGEFQEITVKDQSIRVQIQEH